MGKNAIVGQSGGPTSVINASLAGVFESCKNRGADIVYGMCNGVAGLLEERVVDLSTLLTDDLDIELLKRTPSSFLGSCRYKLPDWRDDEAVYKKLFAILEKLNIGYFFYIGGNDSMDTCLLYTSLDCRTSGVPEDIAALSQRLSRRHFSIGADGIVCSCAPVTAGADAMMRIFNADGSEGKMCGNGIRCVAEWLYTHGMARCV